jgi:hypothetical protein
LRKEVQGVAKFGLSDVMAYFTGNAQEKAALRAGIADALVAEDEEALSGLRTVQNVALFLFPGLGWIASLVSYFTGANFLAKFMAGNEAIAAAEARAEAAAAKQGPAPPWWKVWKKDRAPPPWNRPSEDHPAASDPAETQTQSAPNVVNIGPTFDQAVLCSRHGGALTTDGLQCAFSTRVPDEVAAMAAANDPDGRRAGTRTGTYDEPNGP